jgi:hypothetical protein
MRKMRSVPYITPGMERIRSATKMTLVNGFEYRLICSGRQHVEPIKPELKNKLYLNLNFAIYHSFITYTV